MTRVTGIGGIFLKAQDPQALAQWYRRVLGLATEDWNGVQFSWTEQATGDPTGYTVWSLFPRDTTYFSPGTASCMINYRVDDLDGMLASLRAAGATVDDRIDESEYGRFGWAMDPEGNRFELWEPPVKAEQ
jgi:predicted enzyme related to lactoylglutathione lyase